MSREPLYTDGTIDDLFPGKNHFEALSRKMVKRIRNDYEAKLTELEAQQWVPVERDTVIVELFEMTMEANALEYESEGMAVCRRQGQEVAG
jgi:hypothetical protein